MKFTISAAASLLAFTSSALAFTINFVNNCPYTVWPAVEKAPNGFPDTSVSFGTTLGSGASASFGVDDYALPGIRAWGRTGCDGNDANCATGACNGGMVCNDAGITSGVLLSEFGYGDFGQWGQRTAWDLSRVDASINIDTRLSVSDRQSVTCRGSNCPDDQAYSYSTDYAADRNSALGQTFTHTFCP